MDIWEWSEPLIGSFPQLGLESLCKKNKIATQSQTINNSVKGTAPEWNLTSQSGAKAAFPALLCYSWCWGSWYGFATVFEDTIKLACIIKHFFFFFPQNTFPRAVKCSRLGNRIFSVTCGNLLLPTCSLWQQVGRKFRRESGLLRHLQANRQKQQKNKLLIFTLIWRIFFFRVVKVVEKTGSWEKWSISQFFSKEGTSL